MHQEPSFVPLYLQLISTCVELSDIPLGELQEIRQKVGTKKWDCSMHSSMHLGGPLNVFLEAWVDAHKSSCSNPWVCVPWNPYPIAEWREKESKAKCLRCVDLGHERPQIPTAFMKHQSLLPIPKTVWNPTRNKFLNPGSAILVTSDTKLRFFYSMY